MVCPTGGSSTSGCSDRSGWRGRPGRRATPRPRRTSSIPTPIAVEDEPALAGGSLGAAGELWSTAGDVARWGAFLSAPDPDVLSAAAAEEMRTVHSMMETERWLLGWGLGLSLERRGERVWAGHGGAMPGFLAALAFRPQERLSIAVLTNSGARAEPDELALAPGGEGARAQPGAADGVAPVAAARGGRPAPRRLVVRGVLLHLRVARRTARGAARRLAVVAPARGLRARGAGPAGGRSRAASAASGCASAATTTATSHG